jgi:hypothetical protein
MQLAHFDKADPGDGKGVRAARAARRLSSTQLIRVRPPSPAPTSGRNLLLFS